MSNPSPGFAEGPAPVRRRGFHDLDRLLALRDAQPPDLYGTVSVLGVVGTQAAWQRGDTWQKDLIAVLDRNRHHVQEALRARLPALRHHLPEVPYLTWLDTARLDLPGGGLVSHVRDRGGVLLDGGERFGPGAGRFPRLNFATSPDVLNDILDRVVKALGPRSGQGLSTAS